MEVTRDVVRYSAILDLMPYREFFEKLNIKSMVEIGTCKGVSTAFFAEIVGEIYTFDIKTYAEQQKMLNPYTNIYLYRVPGREDIRKLLKHIKFDFAFIDAVHDYENVSKDFELVRRCGKVLFHDADQFPEVRHFTDEIGARSLGKVSNLRLWDIKDF